MFEPAGVDQVGFVPFGDHDGLRAVEVVAFRQGGADVEQRQRLVLLRARAHRGTGVGHELVGSRYRVGGPGDADGHASGRNLVVDVFTGEGVATYLHGVGRARQQDRGGEIGDRVEPLRKLLGGVLQRWEDDVFGSGVLFEDDDTTVPPLLVGTEV